MVSSGRGVEAEEGIEDAGEVSFVRKSSILQYCFSYES